MAASLNENKCDISSSVFANGMAVSKSSTARLRFPLKTNSDKTYISAKEEGKSDIIYFNYNMNSIFITNHCNL